MSYFEELTKAMTMLAEHPSTIFVGQAVKYPGQRAFESFSGVPMEKRVEMPVVENFQMGYCTGLSLNGYIPISFYPRMDFLIIAADQLINHLDKLPNMGWSPKVIIRTAVGSYKPLDPGPQHTQNYVMPLRQMLKNIPVMEVFVAKYVRETYRTALEYPGSVIVVEHMSSY
jgi:pyruvate/2-oxoglutarate/acetoin dehydrogenase E1 component